jgi:N-methylhydantoinase B
MDVRFAMPVWREGRDLLLALEHRALARHWRGGAGRFSASAISAEQEGLRLPPVKLFKKACWIRKSIRSSVPISACPNKGSAM